MMNYLFWKLLKFLILMQFTVCYASKSSFSSINFIDFEMDTTENFESENFQCETSILSEKFNANYDSFQSAEFQNQPTVNSNTPFLHLLENCENDIWNYQQQSQYDDIFFYNNSYISTNAISQNFRNDIPSFSDSDSYLQIFEDPTASKENTLNDVKYTSSHNMNYSINNLNLNVDTHTKVQQIENPGVSNQEIFASLQSETKIHDEINPIFKLEFFIQNYRFENISFKKLGLNDEIIKIQNEKQKHMIDIDDTCQKSIYNIYNINNVQIASNINIQIDKELDSESSLHKESKEKWNICYLFQKNIIESSINNELTNHEIFSRNINDDELYKEICSIGNKKKKITSYTLRRKNIYESLIDNLKFSSQLNYLLLNYKFDLSNNDLITKFKNTLQESIINTQKTITTKNNTHKLFKNTLALKNNNLKNFCFYCKKEKCHMFSETYKYDDEQFTSLQLYLISVHKSEIHSVVCKFILNNYNIKSHNLYSFLLFFMQNRKLLFKLIREMQIQKLHLTMELKINFIREIFHNFKSNHSKIKIRHLQEFICILLFFLNRNFKIFFHKSNIMFLLFVFYVQSLDNFLNILAKYNFFEQRDVETHNHKIYENLILLLLRINIVEPLVILSTRQKNFSLKYRFHTLFIFNEQYQSVLNQKYDCNRENFLSHFSYWIINIIEHFNNAMFFEIYRKNDINQIFMQNQKYFHDLSKLMIQLESYEPYLQSDFFKNDTHYKNFQNFIQSAKEIDWQRQNQHEIV